MLANNRQLLSNNKNEIINNSNDHHRVNSCNSPVLFTLRLQNTCESTIEVEMRSNGRTGLFYCFFWPYDNLHFLKRFIWLLPHSASCKHTTVLSEINSDHRVRWWISEEIKSLPPCVCLANRILFSNYQLTILFSL